MTVGNRRDENKEFFSLMTELYHRGMDFWPVVTALLLALTATPSADSAVEIAIDVTALPPTAPREMRALVREASALWQTAGVRLTWIESPAARALPHQALVLEVVCDEVETTVVDDGHLRLGSTAFRDGMAEPVLRISMGSVRGLVDRTRWSGQRVDDWPPAMRQELVGRALGRVLAHEIGHFLLAWRRHTPRGLMRAEFDAVELLQTDRRAFRLPAELLPRLMAHLERLTGQGKTLAAVD
jgi:hypothetical protein